MGRLHYRKCAVGAEGGMVSAFGNQVFDQLFGSQVFGSQVFGPQALGHQVVGAAVTGGGSIWSSMFAFEVPPAEKILRTVLVYLGIAVLIRVAGKRQMSQLSTFDLIVALLLSNVVQNAVIGPDNSVAGGLLGALVLVAFNAIMDRVALLGPRTQWLFEGNPTVLVRHGRIDEAAMRRAGVRDRELRAALHHQGADSAAEIEQAALEPGGTLTVELMPDEQAASVGDLRRAVAELQAHLDQKLAALATGER